MWIGKKVLITGASGFLGYWLTKALYEKGADVSVLIRDSDPQSALFHSGLIHKVRVVQGALEDYASVERGINELEIDTVFHLAAQTIVGVALRNPLATFESNVRGTYHLLEACRRHPTLVKRVIIASSDKAYGSSPVLPYTEKMPLQGQHPYDVSKSCADLISLSYHHTYDLPVTVARCGNLFGGGDLNWSRLIPGVIRDLLQGKSPQIRSNGTLTRDYLYVEDAALGYIRLAEQMDRKEIRGEAFNFGPNHPLSVQEVVDEIKKILSCQEVPLTLLNQASKEIQDQSLDSHKARELLGWEPLFTWEQALQQTVGWYQKFLGHAQCCEESLV